MCGICGFYLNRPLNEDDIALGRECIEGLRYRGPDANGYWADKEEGIFLGHTRLVIIDLSDKSSQPMERESHILSYNGEIYNYKEIRDALENEGIGFTTEGDVEVLIKAWIRYREKCLDILDGMYAFALYHNGALHLVTDPFGEKPIYWAKAKEGVYFASEPGPLVSMLDMKRCLSAEDIYDYLLFGFLPPPRTGYKDLYKIPPATHLTFRKGNTQPQIHRYWVPPYPVRRRDAVRPLSEKELDSIQAALFGSLKVRIRSDVPWGVFLSSGIDSNLMLSMIVKDLKIFPKSLTVAFPGQDVTDESKAAGSITKFLDAPHYCVNASDNPSIYEDIDAVLGLYRELNYNSTVIAAYQMAKEARRFVKVALSGMGGDEMFYGYRRYWILYLAGIKGGILPNLLWKSLGLVGRRFFSHNFYFRRMSHFLSLDDFKRVIFSRFERAASWLDTRLDFSKSIKRLFSDISAFYEIGDMSPFEIAQKLDLLIMMPGGYIPAIERGSMRIGLEVRTPYLNRRLFETVARMDQRAFIAFGQKSVLKCILERYLPKRLFDFPKRGFFTPRMALLKNVDMPSLKNIDNIKPEYIRFIWRKKDKPDWCELAIKLATLEAFRRNSKK